MTECKVEGCDKRIHGQGLCRKHYQRQLRNGTIHTVRVIRTTCTVDGCDKPHRAKGYCHMHHTRYLKHGDPNFVTDRRTHVTCTIDGCNRPHEGVGLCHLHNERRKRGIPIGDARTRWEKRQDFFEDLLDIQGFYSAAEVIEMAGVTPRTIANRFKALGREDRAERFVALDSRAKVARRKTRKGEKVSGSAW